MRALKHLLILPLGVLLCGAAQRPTVGTGGNAPDSQARPILAEEVALPVPPELSDLINSSRLRLTDGRTLRDVKVAALDADAITLHTRDGVEIVPYELFPANLQTPLKRFRPAKQYKATVSGDGVVEVHDSAPIDPNAPLRIYYPGRITTAGPAGKAQPLAGAIVIAVRLADYASFEKTRLEKHGAEIAAAQAKALATIKAAQGDAALRPAALTARDEWLLTIYNSFDPLPKSVAMTDTDRNGAFKLECSELEVVLIARGTRPVGDSFDYYTWVARAAATGVKAELTEDNLLRR